VIGTVEVQQDAAPPVWPDPVGKLLGAGGFAAVWELANNRVLKLAHVSHELAQARLAREAEAMIAIGAPSVPHVYGSGVLEDGRAWISMDKIVGTTISDLTTAGAMRASEAVACGLAILESLRAVHAARFVHRDLKPDNLVRRADGSVVILDLGLARKLPDDPDDPTRANVQVGSLEYIPPEQITDSASVDERSDLYAFGCVLYELCAGRPPFIGDAAALERAHTALRPPKLGALAHVPGAVEALVHECLQKEPARRPSSVAVAQARLASASDEPSSVKMAHSMSVIREGKQPVVLLWAELPRVDRALLGMLTGRRLVVVSQRGRRVLAGVLGGEHADPASAAIAAARDLAASGARVALHLEALRVDSAANGSTIHGEPVDKPETWLPAKPWLGVVMTRALATVTQAPTRSSEAGPEFRALADEESSRELFGRDLLLTDLAADAAAALRGMPESSDRSGSGTWHPQGPAFALLLGDSGVGKTVFAVELGKRLAELGVRVHYAAVRAPGTGRPGYTALAPLIGDLKVQGSIVRPIGDALRAAARMRPTAIILDDLHLAEHDLLDALEYATLGGEPLPLWVLGVASPRIDVRRPQLGQRAERHRRDILPPLDEDAAVSLIASLLQPAEYPPLRALRRLVALAHGNPLHLAMLAREIHQRGAVRERPGGAGYFLDISALDDLQQLALGPWLAARELAGLGVELVALARLCAVLGGEIQRDEVVAVVDAVERSGGATTPVDVDIGLAELVRSQILTASEHGYMFRQTLVEEGVYTTTNEDERRVLHHKALDYWSAAQSDDPAVAERIARHAEAIGNRRVAATAFATLGERAHREHRSFDADQAWSGVIRNAAGRDADQSRALMGRARARYRLQRMRDALVDLEQAAQIANEAGDLELEIEALLETGIVLDFTEDFERSKQVAELARKRLSSGAAGYPGLAIDLDLADGRGMFRDQRFAEAAPHLRRVLSAARAGNRHETAAIAALLLGPVLSDLRELEEAERVFGEMIRDCEDLGDRFHLAAAYGNRAWLWSARGMVERTEEDLRLVIQLAREAGQAHFERAATHNLAEHRLWQNELEEALQLARRGLALQSRAGEGSTRPDRLLLARVLAASGQRDELRDVLRSFEDEEGIGPEDLMVIDVLRAALANDKDKWLISLENARSLYLGLRLELWQLGARHQALNTSLKAEAIELASSDPVWSRRLSEF
jgi:tetratricopeptide (TPR) repeat protein/tRNA A-37 threonylcarbamoyl transferase component Bud32